MAGSDDANSVPPVTFWPAIILSLTGFQILEPGGASQAVPNFQVLSSNLPWLVAPAGALSMAWLSTPAGAARGYFFCAVATSSSLAWLKAATVPRPTAAISAAENSMRFMKSVPLQVARKPAFLRPAAGYDS